MTPGTGAFEASQVVAGQLATTCGDLTQNPSVCGVPPSKGNPTAGSVCTIGNLTTCDGKSLVFQGSARAGISGLRLAKIPPKTTTPNHQTAGVTCGKQTPKWRLP
jgi:hypothetical protein